MPNTTVPYTCKLCRRPGTVTLQTNELCDTAWMDTFHKLLVCNPCYDLRDKFRNAESSIVRACTSLVVLDEMSEGEDRSKIIRKLRESLVLSTRKYAEVMAEYRNLPTIVWDDDFVRQLMEDPSHAYSILKKYRKFLTGDRTNEPLSSDDQYRNACSNLPARP